MKLMTEIHVCQQRKPYKERGVAYALLIFFAPLGLHRFYLNNVLHAATFVALFALIFGIHPIIRFMEFTMNESYNTWGTAATVLSWIFAIAFVILCLFDLLFLGDDVAKVNVARGWDESEEQGQPVEPALAVASSE